VKVDAMNKIYSRYLINAGLALFVVIPAMAAAKELSKERAKERIDLTGFSVEQLLDVEVTSAGRKQQKLEDAATAIHVITQEDIRRSGMTTIPDLLRKIGRAHV